MLEMQQTFFQDLFSSMKEKLETLFTTDNLEDTV